MTTLSEFVGKIPAKQPEKFGFSQTCSLLSQYLKENKAALGQLSGTPEVLRQMVTPMNLFPENPIADPTPKSQPAQIQKSINVLPQFAHSGAKMCDPTTEEPKAAQMTIFYAGQVIVFNDFPADKAKELLLLASKGNNSQVFTPQPTLTPKTPNNQVKPNTRGLPPSPVISNPVQDCLLQPQPAEQMASDLPIARRNSLHRFLEKRKDRITAKSPYPAAAAATSATTPKPGEDKPWLSLSASQ
ncbi:hypothetical protein SAY87_023210 [Trapa incisa]|uniref:Protein TIFY n=1 Tax=Trapa incisa TaxID=236973 RepID=A0AAN7K7T0_9MYRT|nr:hypothetical protein SAY87_023210 [Trapa incisa]